MFGVAMIRKQLYVTEAQEEALKAQARSAFPRRSWRAGPSAFLAETSPETARRRPALERLLEHTRDLADRHRLPADYEFDRDELCADRASRASNQSQ